MMMESPPANNGTDFNWDNDANPGAHTEEGEFDFMVWKMNHCLVGRLPSCRPRISKIKLPLLLFFLLRSSTCTYFIPNNIDLCQAWILFLMGCLFISVLYKIGDFMAGKKLGDRYR